ncbi:hypothetical protein AB0M95_06615 [Sphaerisporangium sp. NPDC051017]|uniref:hypothetical protein n=1 Tax=Sphaerisporangium sp. NPDC051017 TaxID=3154636 RepID=UPI00341EA8F0
MSKPIHPTAIAVLYTVTSAFVLAKCVRDRQELGAMSSRVDQARLDRLSDSISES